jgi:hypothetical protein
MQTPTTPSPATRRGLAARLPGRRDRGNPAFYADELRLALAGQPERLAGALTEPGNVDLLTWNIFTSLDTHTDRDYLAYRLQALGGAAVTAPVRIALWVGRTREPLLTPARGYVEEIRRRAAAAGGTAATTRDMEAPAEVPVLIETPGVVVLVDTVLGRVHGGAGGRDRLVELVDAGLDLANRLGKTLAVAVVRPTGSPVAAQLSAGMDRLRDPAGLAAALPHRRALPPVVLRDVTWSQLVALWEAEVPFLRLGGQPVRAFSRQLRSLGLAG